MFTTLPKSRVAEEKASLLSPLELAHLDMCLTGAFARPDSYINIVSYCTTERNGSVFDLYHLEIPEMAFILVVSTITGKMAIIDFVVFETIEARPSQPNA